MGRASLSCSVVPLGWKESLLCFLGGGGVNVRAAALGATRHRLQPKIGPSQRGVNPMQSYHLYRKGLQGLRLGRTVLRGRFVKPLLPWPWRDPATNLKPQTDERQTEEERPAQPKEVSGPSNPSRALSREKLSVPSAPSSVMHLWRHS